MCVTTAVCICLKKKNQNAPRPSEHPPVIMLFVVSHIQRIGCQPEKDYQVLYTVANPARGPLNREKKKKKSLAAPPRALLVELCLYVWPSQPGKDANPARGQQLNRENELFDVLDRA